MSRASVGRGTTSTRSTNDAYGRSNGEYKILCGGRDDEMKDANSTNTSHHLSPKSRVAQLTAPRNTAANNISASIHYIRSILPANDDSCHSNNGFQLQHIISPEEFCSNAKSAVETICKFLKNDREKDPEGS